MVRRAGPPEPGGVRVERAEAFYGWSDNEVVAEAAYVYKHFQAVDRYSAENDDLLRRWGAVCMEMAIRGITDTVTEGGHGDIIDIVTKITTEH
jgi:hypothetical protein